MWVRISNNLQDYEQEYVLEQLRVSGAEGLSAFGAILIATVVRLGAGLAVGQVPGEPAAAFNGDANADASLPEVVESESDSDDDPPHPPAVRPWWSQA